MIPLLISFLLGIPAGTFLGFLIYKGRVRFAEENAAWWRKLSAKAHHPSRPRKLEEEDAADWWKE